ncbi:uncharacterized protein LMH87_007673 [Akanthomyces muscarius]|uniref:Uncharacterized protein n=1 Tax=Akanthomyces muscarius TaxID=2231603 RepID=A0A9W8QLC8_AKAMU|nr:uncharacterized protein LMH87_007673 [Akanthomyces muscarius]KAJ4161646.1 hypothetical protein LMH87_007673 [Akanthomyces muscarius]
MAEADDKIQFIMRAVRDFRQHFPGEDGNHHPGNFECYICFRVRSPELFDLAQPLHAYIDPQGNWLAHTVPCGQNVRLLSTTNGFGPCEILKFKQHLCRPHGVSKSECRFFCADTSIGL